MSQTSHSHGEHYLIVPPEGLLEVIHADGPFDCEGTLRRRTAGGEYVRLAARGIFMHWMSQGWGQLNPRAAWVFHRITTVNFVLTGPVIFEGVDEHLMGEIVGHLSTSDTAVGGDT